MARSSACATPSSGGAEAAAIRLTPRAVALAALRRRGPSLALAGVVLAALCWAWSPDSAGATTLEVRLLGPRGEAVSQCVASVLAPEMDPRQQRRQQRSCSAGLRWDGLAPGPYTLRVQAEGAVRVEVEVDVRAGQATVVGPLRLEPGGAVSGAVRLGGEGVPDALIWVDGLEREPVPSGRNGRFLLRGLPLGAQLLRSRGPNGEVGRSEVEVLPNATVRQDLNLSAADASGTAGPPPGGSATPR